MLMLVGVTSNIWSLPVTPKARAAAVDSVPGEPPPLMALVSSALLYLIKADCRVTRNSLPRKVKQAAMAMVFPGGGVGVTG